MVQTKSFLCVLTISIIFISFLLFQATAGHKDEHSHSVKHHQMKQKIDHLTFYWHDIVSGEKPTAISIVKPVKGSKLYFGGITMIDDPLTLEPDSNSKLLGRAQGFYAGASQETEMAFLMVMNFNFITGKYNGSTISIMGRNPAGHPMREMSVVGGTGPFRFARGYAVATTIQINNITGDAIVRYDVHVMHYKY